MHAEMNHYPAGHAEDRRVFTLVELMVVIAIIAILMAILLPSLKQAKAKAKSIHCVNNLRQVYTCMSNYSSDFNGFLAASLQVIGGTDHYWTGVLAKNGYFGYNRKPLELMCTEEREKEKQYKHKVPKITSATSSSDLSWRYSYGFGIFSASETKMFMRFDNMPKLDNASRPIVDRFLLGCSVQSAGDTDQWYCILKYAVDQGTFFPAHGRRANIVYLHGGTDSIDRTLAWSKWYAQFCP